MTLEITDKNVEETLSSREITVLDFKADWCGPCKMLGPIIDTLAKDYADNDSISIGKINVDENYITTTKYGVRSLPTILFFKNGEVVDKIIGLKTKADIQSKIDSLLSAN